MKSRFKRKLRFCLVIALLAYIKFKYNFKKEGSINSSGSQFSGQGKKMSKQPGIYSDIGKDATDLLYGDYNMQPPICYHFNWLDCSLDLSGGVRASVPGQELRTLLKFYLPYQRSNKVEMQYLRDYFGYTAGISLTKSPLISFSGVIGNGFFNTGTDISLDAATDTVAKCDAGLSFNTDILTASLTLSDKADTLRCLAYRQIQPLTHTGIAAELMYQFSSKQTTLTLGAQHSPFPFMLIKARVASDGSLATLFQHDLLSRLGLTIGAEMNVMDAINTASLGVSLSLKPLRLVSVCVIILGFIGQCLRLRD